MPSRWPIPSENLPARLVANVGQSDDPEDLVDPGEGDVVGVGEVPEVGVGSPRRVKGLRVQQRADLSQRPVELGVRLSVDERRSRSRRVEAHDHPHRRRLAGAVRPEEAGDDARDNLEAQIPRPLWRCRTAWSMSSPRSQNSLSRPGGAAAMALPGIFRRGLARPWRPGRPPGIRAQPWLALPCNRWISASYSPLQEVGLSDRQQLDLHPDHHLRRRS